MERVIKKDRYGNVACNNILIYTNNRTCLGDNIENDLNQDWKVIKPKYYKYKDDNTILEIWYNGKGILLNGKLEGYINEYWMDELREEITYKEAMLILEQKQNKNLGYNNKDLMSRIEDELEKENNNCVRGTKEQSKEKDYILEDDKQRKDLMSRVITNVATAGTDCAKDDMVDAMKFYFYKLENKNESPAKKQNNNGGASDFTPDYYGARCKCGEKIDAYTICDKYAKPHKGSAWHHALKKLIRAGDGHKPLEKDIKEVIDSLNRWLEQID